jgi:hypothetical protein
MPLAPLSNRALALVFPSSDIIQTGIWIVRDLLFQTISTITSVAFSDWSAAKVLVVHEGRNITLTDDAAGE